MATFLSIPPPFSLTLRRRPSYLHPPRSSSIKPLHITTLCSSAAPQTATSVAADEDSPTPPQSEAAVQDLQSGGCKTCGREVIENGCNGEGRMQGGIATVPGFGWWPIKAYRPCPGFVASGGRYRRRGQTMDEVAFGRGGRDPSAGITDAVK